MYRARRYDEAIAQARRTLELDPAFGVALFWLEGSLRHKGLFKEAVALRQSASRTPEQAQLIARTVQRDGFQALLRESGETFRKSGLLETAARCLRTDGETDDGDRAPRGLLRTPVLGSCQPECGTGFRRPA